MGVTTTLINKPFSPRGNDQSPLAFNRAKLFSGKALDFDGVNDDITIPNSDSINITGNALTIAGYINTDGSTAWQGICYKDGGNNKGYQLFVDKTGDPNIAFGIHTGGFYRLYSNEVIENNKWYFVVATYDGVNQSIYINGVFDNSQAATGNITDSSTENLYIGRNTGGSERFNGEIGGFKIFNTALTAAQVADLYNNPEKVVPTGVDNTALKLWLPMMEGAGTTAYDGSGNGNHGTISGATYVNGVGAPVSQSAVMDWNKGVNELQYSEEFDNIFWTKSKTTITANDTTAPDGSTNADKLEITTSGGNNEVYRYVGTIAIGHALSIYVKKDTARWFALGTNVQTTKMVWFDLDNGVVGTEATGYTGVMTDEGNGWYRCGVIIGAGADTSTYIDMSLTNSDGVLGGNVGLSVFIWGAQAEQASSVGPYIPTLSTAQPTPVLLPQGLTTGRDITGVNLFENVRKQGALNLDGNSWAEVHDNGSLDFGTGSLTFEAWAKYSYVSQGSSLNAILSLGGDIGQGAGYGRAGLVSSSSGSSMSFFYNSTGNASTSSFSDGDWVHVVGVYDETSVIVYINGAEERTTARTAASMTNTDVKQIGRDSTAIRYYNDQIAQPRIYNRALTAEEVQRSYDSGKNIYTNS